MHNNPRVVVTRRIPEPGLTLLADQGYEVIVGKNEKPPTKKELLKMVVDADAIVSLLTDTIDADVIAAAGRHCKIIANYAVGFDNIDNKAAHKHKIYVTNTPDQLNQAVAEHTIALLFGCARHLVAADQFTRAGKYRGWDPGLLLGTELKGKTIGIIGSGRIGTAVAELAHFGLRMEVRYTDIKRNRALESALGAQFSDLETLCKESDVVSIHVPLLESTHHLINWQRLKQMKRSAILINTARGAIINQTDLIRALQAGEIAAAGLDVYEHEPEIPEVLLKLPNVTLTPHIASATTEAREAMSRQVANNVIAALQGSTPPNTVS